MAEYESDTQQNILAAAKSEFLKMGFRGASLRRIVKLANVTTGAFYGYYKSKAELFDALVSEPADYFMSEFNCVQEKFKKLSPQQQEQEMGKLSGNAMLRLIDYIIDNADAFKMVLKCSEGTKYEDYIHTIVQTEITATHDFAEVLSSAGKDIHTADESLEHILVSGMFSAYFEIALHDIPKENAYEYVKQLNAFYTAGWSKIMGL